MTLEQQRPSPIAELKAAGRMRSIGVGAKDISVIDFISELDWAMFACSATPYAHGEVARNLLTKLGKQKVQVINSAVFNADFLIGGDHFDYRKVERETEPALFERRDKFNGLCAEFGIKPAAACVQFSFPIPGDRLGRTQYHQALPRRLERRAGCAVVPTAFWEEMKKAGLISKEVGPCGSESPRSATGCQAATRIREALGVTLGYLQRTVQ